MFKEQAFGLVTVNGTKACALGIHRCSPESAYGGAEIIRCGIFRSCVNDRFMPPVNSDVYFPFICSSSDRRIKAITSKIRENSFRLSEDLRHAL